MGIGFAAVVAALGVTTLGAAAGTSTPNDPVFPKQWALAGSAAAINAPGAWPVATGYGVLVGDVDTGANFANPDLQGKLVPGAQFLSCPGAGTGPIGESPSGTGQAAVQDDVGHGSMTTGIVVAGTNNGQGIAAVAPDAKALIVKVLARTIQNDSNGNPQYAYGSGCDNDVGAGIQWAVDHGAQVINLSIGSEVPLTGSVGDITNAITYAWNHDVAVAVAAGNNQLPVSDYSTIQNEALVVGALGPSGSVAYYSTKNVGVNLYAPGGDDNNGANQDIQHLVVSTGWRDPQFGGGDYTMGQGTSFAAPQAAGVLALLRSCGFGGQAAVQRVKSIAANHGNHLDAGATLAGVSHCAQPPSSSSTGNGLPASGNQGGTPTGGGSGGQRHAGGPVATGNPSAKPVPSGATPSGGPAAGVAGGLDGGGGNHGLPGSPAGVGAPPAGGASPNPLLLAGLGGLVVVGAPAAAWLVKGMRAPLPPR